MTTDDILNLDYRLEANKIKLKKALCRIKPLSKYEDEEEIPLEKLEKLIGMFSRKYKIMIQYINMTCIKNNEENLFLVSLKTTDKENKWLGSIYGCCLYELFAKTAIKMYVLIKSGEIEKAED